MKNTWICIGRSRNAFFFSLKTCWRVCKCSRLRTEMIFIAHFRTKISLCRNNHTSFAKRLLLAKPENYKIKNQKLKLKMFKQNCWTNLTIRLLIKDSLFDSYRYNKVSLLKEYNLFFFLLKMVLASQYNTNLA